MNTPQLFASYDTSKIVCGVDEAGRGPLFGDVVAAAVVLDPSQVIVGLADSKKLSATKRQILYDKIYANAKSVAVGRASVAEIDQLNILQASLLAMQRAVEQLSILPDIVLVDGNQAPVLSCQELSCQELSCQELSCQELSCQELSRQGPPCQVHTVIKGDAKHACISAASIVAKVTRDKDMLYWHTIYPHLGLDSHKGYPTKQHLHAIKTHGVCPQHRLSFAPVAKIAGSNG